MLERLPHLTDGILLVAATVAVHSAGTFIVLWSMVRYRRRAEAHFGFVHNTAVVTAVVLALLFTHFVEIAGWDVFYKVQNCFPNFRTAVSFSLDSYSTVGYGDVLLENEWRLLGGVEAMTGILMVSWSTAVMLGLVTWIYKRRLDDWSNATSNRATPDSSPLLRRSGD
jgi:voltage-gated potassium channel